MKRLVNVRTISIVLFIILLLNAIDTVSLVDETFISNRMHNELIESDSTDSSFRLVDSLKLGSDYIDMDRWSLDISGNYLYMGSSYNLNSIGKMIIIDISNPTNLVEVGRVENLGKCNRIIARENLVYYADDEYGMLIFNVSNPNDVTILGEYPASYLNDICITDDIAYLVALSDDLIILNVSDPSNLVEIGSYSTSIYMTRILVRDDLAYIATRDNLEIVDVSDPSNPFLISSVYSGGHAWNMFLDGDIVFVSFYSTQGRLYNVSDPYSPVELEDYYLGYGIGGVQVIDSLVFISSSDMDLQAFHLNTYQFNSDIGRFRLDDQARAVLYHEGYFYLIDNYSGLWCLEHDCDKDELYSRQEFELGTNSGNPDSDFDSMPDGWEVQNGLNPLVDDSQQDNDEDGLSAIEEYLAGTSIFSNDTDSDALSDSEELLEYGTNPVNSDSDFDQMPDGWEVLYGLNPLFNDGNLDLDMDGLSNRLEYQIGTNPTLLDSDNDTFSDMWEYDNGFDPTNPVVTLSQYLVAFQGWIIIGFLVELVVIAVIMFRKRRAINITDEEDIDDILL